MTTISIHDTPDLPVQTLSVPPLSLGLLSTPQSLRTFHLTLAPLARCLCMQGPPLCIAGTPGGDGNSPRTHCHFMMQARALRVPELCDDHTPPSCLVTNSLAKPRYRSPDPLLTQGGPVTFLACVSHELFVRSCDLAHHGLCCSHVCVCTHHSSLQHLPFLCLPLLISCAHMDEPQCMRLPLGTTEWNHSYYTGNSLSALHSLQQLQAGASSPSPVQMSASSRESHGAAPSSSVSRSQVTLSATHPQLQMDPTRTITSGLLSATLAEAATQLFIGCILSND